jgi:hypothetical protein
MRFIRRLIIATAQWVALLSIFVVTFSGGLSGWSWVLGDPNTDDKWGYVGFLAGAFIGFAIAATLAGAYFCLVVGPVMAKSGKKFWLNSRLPKRAI